MTWETIALGEACDVKVGRTPARANSEYWGPGEAWLSIADMAQGRWITRTKEQITSAGAGVSQPVSVGTVLLSFKLSIGRVARAAIPLFTNEAIAALPIREGVPLEEPFLVRALEQLDLSADSNRAAMGATLNKRQLLQLPIPLPPIEEQRQIAAILDQADEIRAKRRAQLVQLDELPQVLFREMFGTSAEWVDRWTIGTVDDISESVQYGSSSKAGATGKWPILRMGNITDLGSIDFSDLKYLDIAESDIEKYTLRAGDVLFNRTNSLEKVGKSAVVRDNRPLAYAGYLVRVRLKAGHQPDFLTSFLNGSYGRSLRRKLAKAAVNQANINATQLRGVQLPIPPAAEQQAFAEKIEAIRAERSLVARALEADDELFAALQHRAFRGEL